jgi:hypothetical protein
MRIRRVYSPLGPYGYHIYYRGSAAFPVVQRRLHVPLGIAAGVWRVLRGC